MNETIGGKAGKNDRRRTRIITKSRVKKLIELGNKLTEEYKEKNIGKTLHVLIENYDEKTKLYHGLTENYLDYYLSSEENIINKIIEITYKKWFKNHFFWFFYQILKVIFV